MSDEKQRWEREREREGRLPSKLTFCRDEEERERAEEGDASAAWRSMSGVDEAHALLGAAPLRCRAVLMFGPKNGLISCLNSKTLLIFLIIKGRPSMSRTRPGLGFRHDTYECGIVI